MRTRRFDFNWRSLQMQISFYIEGSVPDKQNYDADTGEYTPDYTVTPMIIQPAISILDKDDVLAGGRINSELTNIRWYEIVNSTKTLITTDNSDYEITTGGDDAGRIMVKKNVEPQIPLTLVFYAEYVDIRTNQLHIIQGSYLLTCVSAATEVHLELDAAEQSVYNPLSDEALQTVTATVWVGDSKCTDTSCYKLVWEVQEEDGTWREAESDEVMDYDITIDGNTAIINKWLMGSELHLRCRCRYSSKGNPSSVELNDASPQAVAVFVRRAPAYEYDIMGVPYNIPAGLEEIAPTALVRTTVGNVEGFEKELLPLWYIATNKVSGSLVYSLVAHGVNPAIATESFDNTYGAVIGLDVKDRGYIGALVDNTDGYVLADAEGDILVIH